MTHLETRLIPTRFQPVLEAIARASGTLSDRIRRGGEMAEGAAAEALFPAALREAGVRWLSTRRHPQPQALQPGGALAVALDPLEGASGIEANMPAGTIFAVFAASDTGEASFLRPARDMLAAGYVLHGPRCCLVVSCGHGTQVHVLDPESRRFVLTHERVVLPAASPEFAIDTAHYRHWARPVRAYVDDCMAGAEGPRARAFSMRWTSSLTTEAHRILMRGGIFLDPAIARPGGERGRLRLLHQAAPIAFLIEQAGGRATDGALPLLDAPFADLAALSPLVFGSADKVDRVAGYHDLPEAEVSALFGHRGLFRA